MSIYFFQNGCVPLGDLTGTLRENLSGLIATILSLQYTAPCDNFFH